MYSFLEHDVSSKKCLTHPECTSGKLFLRERVSRYLGKVVPYFVYIYIFAEKKSGRYRTLDRPRLKFSFSFLFSSFFPLSLSLPPLLVPSFHFIHASELWGFDKCHGLSVRGGGEKSKVTRGKLEVATYGTLPRTYLYLLQLSACAPMTSDL